MKKNRPISKNRKLVTKLITFNNRTTIHCIAKTVYDFIEQIYLFNKMMNQKIDEKIKPY